MLTASALAACGDDTTMEVATVSTTRPDSGPFDAGAPPPIPVFPELDAAALIDGSPPDALVDQPCAVDTNKLFELVRTFDAPETSQLAVDAIASRFGVAYVGMNPGCGNTLYLAEIEGPSGAPPPEVHAAVEECTTIQHPTLTRSDDAWLFGFVDNRLPGLDVWAQPFDPRDDAAPPAQRITESPLEKTYLQLASLGPDGAMIAWVETAQDPLDFQRTDSLKVRSLWVDGQPYAPEVTLASGPDRPVDCPPAGGGSESKECGRWLDRWHYRDLRLARIGASNAALAYRRDSRSGAEIVLRILDVDGNPVDDPWVLTTEPGPRGTVDLATDEEGGAVIYSVEQNSAPNVMMQRLDAEGKAAPLFVGAMSVGPSPPVEIVGAPLHAIDPSVAKLPKGFTVAYRALPAGDSTLGGTPSIHTGIFEPQIRIVFLDSLGARRGESSLAFAESAGGGTSIESAYDGRMVITWTDSHDDASSSIMAIRLPCVGAP